jgi:galactokinase
MSGKGEGGRGKGDPREAGIENRESWRASRETGEGAPLGVNDAREFFRRAFGGEPKLIAEAPGRVNLIGEHIDYLGLAVLPMALQRGVTAAARPRADRDVRIVSAMRGGRLRRFTLDSVIPHYRRGDWGNYAKAAGQWICRRYGDVRGADIAIVSDLPVAMGLSSSSALVVAVALALLGANGLDVEPLNLAEELAGAERYVGTRGGGMDQAVCLAARAGTALRVEFAPLRTTAVPIPPDWCFVVMSSTVVAPKSGSMREKYNRRRAQAERAVREVARDLGVESEVPMYRSLMSEHPVSRLLAVGEHILSPDVLGRFRHAVTEGERVRGAEAALRAGAIAAFGRLLSASHASLRDDLGVSCDELDRVTATAEGAGAAGARLTGAGFGGAAVALCRGLEGATAVMDALDREFYALRLRGGEPGGARFLAEPGGRAWFKDL